MQRLIDFVTFPSPPSSYSVHTCLDQLFFLNAASVSGKKRSAECLSNNCATVKRDDSNGGKSHGSPGGGNSSGSRDGLPIPCLYTAPPKPEKAYHVLVHAHSNGCDIGDMAPAVRLIALNLNVHVFAFEYPGYGLYAGKANSQTLKRTQAVVMEFIFDQLQLAPERVIWFGRSIGSGVACALANATALRYGQMRVGGLVIQCGFAKFDEVAFHLFGKMAKLVVRDQWKNLDYVKQMECPILILHGKRDQMIPISQAEKLWKFIKNKECSLFYACNCGHNDFNFARCTLVPMEAFLRNIIDRLGTRGVPDRALFFTLPVDKRPSIYHLGLLKNRLARMRLKRIPLSVLQARLSDAADTGQMSAPLPHGNSGFLMFPPRYAPAASTAQQMEAENRLRKDRGSLASGRQGSIGPSIVTTRGAGPDGSTSEHGAPAATSLPPRDRSAPQRDFSDKATPSAAERVSIGSAPSRGSVPVELGALVTSNPQPVASNQAPNNNMGPVDSSSLGGGACEGGAAASYANIVQQKRINDSGAASPLTKGEGPSARPTTDSDENSDEDSSQNEVPDELKLDQLPDRSGEAREARRNSREDNRTDQSNADRKNGRRKIRGGMLRRGMCVCADDAGGDIEVCLICQEDTCMYIFEPFLLAPKDAQLPYQLVTPHILKDASQLMHLVVGRMLAFIDYVCTRLDELKHDANAPLQDVVEMVQAEFWLRAPLPTLYEEVPILKATGAPASVRYFRFGPFMIREREEQNIFERSVTGGSREGHTVSSSSCHIVYNVGQAQELRVNDQTSDNNIPEPPPDFVQRDSSITFVGNNKNNEENTLNNSNVRKKRALQIAENVERGAERYDPERNCENSPHRARSRPYIEADFPRDKESGKSQISHVVRIPIWGYCPSPQQFRYLTERCVLGSRKLLAAIAPPSHLAGLLGGANGATEKESSAYPAERTSRAMEKRPITAPPPDSDYEDYDRDYSVHEDHGKTKRTSVVFTEKRPQAQTKKEAQRAMRKERKKHPRKLDLACAFAQTWIEGLVTSAGLRIASRIRGESYINNSNNNNINASARSNARGPGYGGTSSLANNWSWGPATSGGPGGAATDATGRENCTTDVEEVEKSSRVAKFGISEIGSVGQRTLEGDRDSLGTGGRFGSMGRQSSGTGGNSATGSAENSGAENGNTRNINSHSAGSSANESDHQDPHYSRSRGYLQQNTEKGQNNNSSGGLRSTNNNASSSSTKKKNQEDEEGSSVPKMQRRFRPGDPAGVTPSMAPEEIAAAQREMNQNKASSSIQIQNDIQNSADNAAKIPRRKISGEEFIKKPQTEGRHSVLLEESLSRRDAATSSSSDPHSSAPNVDTRATTTTVRSSTITEDFHHEGTHSKIPSESLDSAQSGQDPASVNSFNIGTNSNEDAAPGNANIDPQNPATNVVLQIGRPYNGENSGGENNASSSYQTPASSANGAQSSGTFRGGPGLQMSGPGPGSRRGEDDVFSVLRNPYCQYAHSNSSTRREIFGVTDTISEVLAMYLKNGRVKTASVTDLLDSLMLAQISHIFVGDYFASALLPHFFEYSEKNWGEAYKDPTAAALRRNLHAVMSVLFRPELLNITQNDFLP